LLLPEMLVTAWSVEGVTVVTSIFKRKHFFLFIIYIGSIYLYKVPDIRVTRVTSLK